MQRAAIRNNATGEVRVRDYPELQWSDGSEWWWTEGNFGCDCNREWEFQRAGGEEESDDPECGESRYSLIWLEGDNGFRAEWPGGDRVQAS